MSDNWIVTISTININGKQETHKCEAKTREELARIIITFKPKRGSIITGVTAFYEPTLF